MKIHYQDGIVAGDDIEIPFPAPFQGELMLGKKDLVLLIAGIGGVTSVPGDVTMSVTILADIGPDAIDDSGTVVDSSRWVDITPSAYCLDTDASGAASYDFTGATEAVTMLRLANLDVDKLKFVASFSAAPNGATSAQILIKGRIDDI